MSRLEAGQHALGFWLRHVRIGVSMSLLTLAVGGVYVAMGPEGDRRGVLLGLLCLGFVVTTAVTRLPLERILSGPHGMRFLYTWTTALCGLIFLGVLADGGGSSPLSLLFVLPLIFAAISYPPAGVVAYGGLVLGAALLTAALGQPMPAGRTVLWAGTLVAVTIMCAVTARNHWRTLSAQTTLARRLGHLAHHDGLTGCLNHRAFHERLTAAADDAETARQPLALLVIDLDHFKQLNDVHGHPAGDAMLAQVAAAIIATVRDDDVVGRIGGDEFAVLLPGTDAAAALPIAEALRAAIGALRRPVRGTASIGIAAMPDGARDAATLIANADRAVYRAKRSGRDFVSLHGSHERTERTGSEADETVRLRVREIVESETVVSVFQPVVRLSDGAVVGYEALARITGSNLAPDHWLALAEQVGYRDELEAAMWAAALRAGPTPRDVPLFLNASPSALLSGALAPWVDALPPGTAIEVSEHHAVGDYGLLTRDLGKWVAAGVHIAVDDLGAGHANLHHVLHLAPHWLKLDRSLVSGVHHHPSRIALLESLVTFASRIGSRIIAEGIETEQEAAALAAAGVRYGQGFLFARPGAPWPRVEWRPPLIEQLVEESRPA